MEKIKRERKREETKMSFCLFSIVPGRNFMFEFFLRRSFVCRSFLFFFIYYLLCLYLFSMFVATTCGATIQCVCDCVVLVIALIGCRLVVVCTMLAWFGLLFFIYFCPIQFSVSYTRSFVAVSVATIDRRLEKTSIALEASSIEITVCMDFAKR